MEEKLAVVTGADGGMGREITEAFAAEGYHVIMACKTVSHAETVMAEILKKFPDAKLEVRFLDLSSFASVNSFALELLEKKCRISRLMNNAGILSTNVRRSFDGIETLVSVNYVAPFFLTLLLLPLMDKGSRIINTVSCTYVIGKIEKDFLINGKNGRFARIPVYSNTKLALLLFTEELSKRVVDRGITVNAADPGIVSTDMIRLHEWFDPLTDIFFRPFIRKPRKGAGTAIYLGLSEEVSQKSGGCYASCREKTVPERILHYDGRLKLWDDTLNLLRQKGYVLTDIPKFVP